MTVGACESGSDVIAFLKGQHRRTEKLFAQLGRSVGAAREEAFAELRSTLAIHETAEELIVHPAARSLPGLEGHVERRLQEEHRAKCLLVALEHLPVDSGTFSTQLRALEGIVGDHVESEERFEFDGLTMRFDTRQLQRMKKLVSLAESLAPTHPHPGFESAAANVLAGPFATVLDRLRDAVLRTIG